ncbi:MAG: hypothetical protein LBB42_00535 [Coriobacteriales bacterium]|jgi:hypothetical protein|nr:hypothetical protein [Coriobacteriales bacterium]
MSDPKQTEQQAELLRALTSIASADTSTLSEGSTNTLGESSLFDIGIPAEPSFPAEPIMPAEPFLLPDEPKMPAEPQLPAEFEGSFDTAAYIASLSQSMPLVADQTGVHAAIEQDMTSSNEDKSSKKKPPQKVAAPKPKPIPAPVPMQSGLPTTRPSSPYQPPQESGYYEEQNKPSRTPQAPPRKKGCLRNPFVIFAILLWVGASAFSAFDQTNNNSSFLSDTSYDSQDNSYYDDDESWKYIEGPAHCESENFGIAFDLPAGWNFHEDYTSSHESLFIVYFGDDSLAAYGGVSLMRFEWESFPDAEDAAFEEYFLRFVPTGEVNVEHQGFVENSGLLWHQMNYASQEKNWRDVYEQGVIFVAEDSNRGGVVVYRLYGFSPSPEASDFSARAEGLGLFESLEFLD